MSAITPNLRLPAAPRCARIYARRVLIASVIAIVMTGALVARAFADVRSLDVANHASRAELIAQSPRIDHVRARYDTAGLVRLTLAFTPPPGLATPIDPSTDRTLDITLGHGTSSDPRGCTPVAHLTAGLMSAQSDTLTVSGVPVPVTAQRSSGETTFSATGPSIAGRNITCLTVTSTSSPQLGSVVVPVIGPDGSSVLWFAGYAPLPPVTAPTRTTAWIATITQPVWALTAPGHGRHAGWCATNSPVDQGPNSLLVLGTRHLSHGQLWLRLRLPDRPNTASGWIPARDATLASTQWRISVNVRQRTLTIFHSGRIVHRVLVVIGAPATPTPTGQFAVAAIIRQADPHGFLGPWALHLTAHSNVLENFGGGPGRVAIHGRDGASLRDPLGSARSHGCIRIPNNWVSYLALRVPRGTPVSVQ